METTSSPSGLVDPDLTSEQYHADPALGSSGLKALMRSPAHYWADFLDPEREQRDSKAFRIGRAWHAQVFEPATFEERYITMPEGLDRRTKEGKQLWEEILASGRDPLPMSEVRTVQRMAAKARQHPISRVVLAAEGVAECSLFWREPDSGVHLKIRPDWMIPPCKAFPAGLIVDGKSTGDASPEAFGRSVWNLDYGMQAALYTHVFRCVMRSPARPTFMWLAQEKSSPYAAAWYAAGVDLIQHYEAQIPKLLGLFARCQMAGEWPAYPERVETLAMPAWAQREIDGATQSTTL